ncbi:MAG: glycosyltransferase family 2 protein [Phycisphaerae bacterium]
MSTRADPTQPPSADAPTLSIVIPVYNEQESLPALFERLARLCIPLADTPHEVIFVDDHSTDASPRMLVEACRQTPNYRFIRLARNSGSHIAIFAGLDHARGRCAVFLAADLQDPPELIPQMLERWRAGHEVVWAVRAERQGIPLSEKLFASAFYAVFNRVAHVSLPPQGSDFALLDRVILDGLKASVNASPFLMGEIAQLGYRQTRVDYVKAERRFGATKWNVRKKLRLFADAFVACSYFPLRAMSYVGLSCSAIGFLYALFVIIWTLIGGGPVAGWSSLMVVVLVLGGIQMTMLGVLGEYLWRTLEEARRRPPYFIEASAGVSVASPISRESVRRSVPIAFVSGASRPEPAAPPAARPQG